MPNKSVEKHRQASKEGMQRFRAKQKALKAEAAGIAKPVTAKQAHIDSLVVIKNETAKPMPTINPFVNEPGCETPAGLVQAVPVRYGMADCKCRHCKLDKGKHKINHWAYKIAHELEKNEINRVVLPGDVDYKGAAALLLLDAAHGA